ncbi:MAG: hypothetical protein IT581_02155 [Verrucomicrobiales bacterium]|nr:hypothetical protein [Verrucomicrobiales bacterium]
MKTARFLLYLCWLATVGAGRTHAQTYTQTFELRPGWNALWLEVDPADRQPASVFAGVPVASVWTWSERVSATDFIQNPEATGWNRAQWLAWFPPTSEESILANLHAVLPQRAYLLRLAGTNAVTWKITGKPTLKTPPWAPDQFNLRGFPVDPDVNPTFGQFFRASPAHYSTTTSQLESMYRLDADGEWRAVKPEDPMHRGEAYWVYTRGPSDYVAPFSLELNSGEGLEFAGGLDRIELTLRNAHPVGKSIRLEPAGPHASPLLLLPPVLSNPTNAPRPLGTHNQVVAGNAAESLRLGIDRAQLGSSLATDPNTGKHGTLMSVSDGQGTRFLVSVSAVANVTSDFTGLWSGSIVITNVGPTLDLTNNSGPVPVGFPLRMLLHVDTAGQVQLLRDVTIVTTRTNGVLTSTPTTELVTDPSRLISYPSSDIRTGTVRGRRLTSPHFDFARGPGQFSLALQGTLGPSNVVSGTLSLPTDAPGNPFRHRYHPDHATNAYVVTREIRMDLNQPVAGDDSHLGGTYSETLIGLHKLPLQVSGSLELHRLSTVGALNTVTAP